MDRIRLGTVTITEREKEYIGQVLQNSYLSPGKFTREFEKQVAAAHDKKYALALNSGQSAIMVVLQAAKIMYGIKMVAVPAITYISSISAIIQAGLNFKLVDVTPDANAEMIWNQIPSFVDAALPCHLFGRANKDCASEGRFVCEDACESIYAEGIGFGNAVCLSFYPSHTITAGFGGMILTNDKDLYFKCWQLVNHGRADWDDYTTCHNLKERFKFSEFGYSLKFSDLNAAVGLAQHQNRQYILGRRKNNAKYILSCLRDLERKEYLKLPTETNHTFMMFPMVDLTGTRDSLENKLNDVNIETRRMMPITTQPVITDYLGTEIQYSYPGASFINKNGFYFGCHQGLKIKELDRIIDTIREHYRK